LREKEKGDWRKLTLEEKKALYRASFGQTFAEIKAPTGEWKALIGFSLVGISIAMWMFIWMKQFGEFCKTSNLYLTLFNLVFLIFTVYQPLPITFSPERQQAQLERMINMQVNAVEGLGSKYDYEKGQWKE